MKDRYPYHRRFVRYPVRLRVEVRADEKHDAWTQNLSIGGLCFDIPRQVEVGETVGLSIHLRDKQHDKPVECKCKIVWNEQGEKGYRHGGQFTLLGEDILIRLRTYLARA